MSPPCSPDRRHCSTSRVGQQVSMAGRELDRGRLDLAGEEFTDRGASSDASGGPPASSASGADAVPGPTAPRPIQLHRAG